MLTSYDISVMEDSVREVIGMWGTNVQVLKPLPIASQPNWNEHMHEYSGDIHYVRYDNMPVERKDQVNMMAYDHEISNGAGDKQDGRLIFTTSDLNTFMDDTCRVVYNGEQWRIDQIRPRIGEVVFIIAKITGSNEKWATDPDSVVNCQAVV